MATNYVTLSDLKTTLSITSSTSDTDLNTAIDAASRLVEEYKRLDAGRSVRYYPTTETRYYTPSPTRARAGYYMGGNYELSLDIDDAVTVSTVLVDRAVNYSYSESWTASVDYLLEPANNPLESKPQRTIVRIPAAGKPFPCHTQSVKVTGSFGWATAPSLVKQATQILAARLYGRRNSPNGILALGVDSGAAIRLPRTDPDVVALLDSVDSNVPRLFA